MKPLKNQVALPPIEGSVRAHLTTTTLFCSNFCICYRPCCTLASVTLGWPSQRLPGQPSAPLAGLAGAPLLLVFCWYFVGTLLELCWYRWYYVGIMLVLCCY